MHSKTFTALLVSLLVSCMAAKKVNHHDEIVNFYEDLLLEEKTFCSKRINNDYWIEEIENLRLVAMRKYLDSAGTNTSAHYLEYETTHNLLTLQSASIPKEITIDYEKVIMDLRLTNNMKLSRFTQCDAVSTGHISLPIFDKGCSRAVIETEGGTFLFEKINGRWKFTERGLLRVF